MIDPLYSLALVTGLLGTGHCLGMCGGLVAALSLAGGKNHHGCWFHLLYNLGRLSTYAMIGAAVGWLGSAIAFTDAFKGFSRILLVASDLFIILVGLGSAGLFSVFGILHLEFPGTGASVSSLVRHLATKSPAVAAVPLGLVLGFLPCGLVYALAITAAQTLDPLRGAAVMLCFGLGTAPALVLFGGTVQWLGHRARSWMLRGAGAMVALMGLFNLYRHLHLMGIWQ